jgi:hypothetical protein
VADDFELQVLDQLALRAGVIWTHEGCESTPGDQETCVSCGRTRAEIEAEDES